MDYETGSYGYNTVIIFPFPSFLKTKLLSKNLISPPQPRSIPVGIHLPLSIFPSQNPNLSLSHVVNLLRFLAATPSSPAITPEYKGSLATLRICSGTVDYLGLHTVSKLSFVRIFPLICRLQPTIIGKLRYQTLLSIALCMVALCYAFFIYSFRY
ncbi:hypothetical protein HanPI659440_Chr00c16g0728281 [Helianthus annuus]|nr:hypothetical protein HanPI659440_Chr00c16g0728281 [Helianthus annuus]